MRKCSEKGLILIMVVAIEIGSDLGSSLWSRPRLRRSSKLRTKKCVLTGIFIGTISFIIHERLDYRKVGRLRDQLGRNRVPKEVPSRRQYQLIRSHFQVF